MREEDLTPMQYMIMETLAARVRLGEQVWTFPNNRHFISPLKVLERENLIGWKHNTNNDLMVWFTSAGKRMFTVSTYKSPNAGKQKCSAQDCKKKGNWEWEGLADVRMTLILNCRCTWWFCDEHDKWHRESIYYIQGRPILGRDL